VLLVSGLVYPDCISSLPVPVIAQRIQSFPVEAASARMYRVAAFASSDA
jgi:hypothetical protein